MLTDQIDGIKFIPDTMGTQCVRSFSKLIKLCYNKAGQIDIEQVTVACQILNNGGVIAFPTDTVYGMAAKLQDPCALERIYKIKGRDSAKPLAVCLSSVEEITDVAEFHKPVQKRICEALLPGSITIILKRSPQLNKNFNPGIDTVGIRVPDHNFVMALSRIVGPLALTSANRSGQPSPLYAQDFEEMWPELDAIYDNGIARKHFAIETGQTGDHKLGSTIVDLTVPMKYTIVREGCSLNKVHSLLSRFGYRNISNKSPPKT